MNENKDIKNSKRAFTLGNMLRAKPVNKLYAFTLAEVLITLAIIGVVAALTIPTVVKNYKEKQTVSQVKKFYRNFASIVQQWQVEEGCASNVSDCISSYAYGCSYSFPGIESKLKVLKKVPQTLAQTNVDWLPATNTLLNGSTLTSAWQGVTNAASPQGYVCKYLLADGVTFSIHSDTSRKSMIGFFDINGKKEPNRVGKDIFPIGIGAFDNPKYTSVHPFYNEDAGNDGLGLCNIAKGRICNPDTCTQTSCSPTAYVLKNDKLPPITW